MRKFSKHTPEQIVVKLEKAEALRGEGMSTAQACRVLGISEATLCRWRQRYGAMNRSEAKELRELREQNARLKQLLGQAELEKAALRELAEGHFISHPRPNDLGAAATLIRFRQSRCRIQWVTWSVVFELSGAQARPARKIFCKQRLLVHR